MSRTRAPSRRAKRPDVTLKAAITLDGRIATANGDSKWITSEASRKLAHRMRAQVDAVMVGVGTVLADDPELTVRHARGKNPLRVVLDTRLRTPASSRIAGASPHARTLFVHGPKAPRAQRTRLTERGAELLEVALDAQRKHLDLKAALEALFARGVRTLLVEGGSELHGALLAQKLVDRVAVFVAPRLLVDSSAKPLAAGPAKNSIAEALALSNVRYRKVGQDFLVLGTLE